MEVNIVPTTRTPFTLEVGYFETIQDIKEKIQKTHKIPIEKQTLIFNNQILSDNLSIFLLNIGYNSQIQLITSGDQESSTPAPATAGTTSSEFRSSSGNRDPFESWLDEMVEFVNSPLSTEGPATIINNQESTAAPATIFPASTSGEFGSSMGNVDPLESWLQEVEQESTPPLEKSTSVKVSQESTPPPAPPPPPTRVTTFSELGITPENTYNQSKTWASWLSEMDLVENSKNQYGNFALNIAPSATKKITLLLKIPATGISQMPIELEINDSIHRLKENIVNNVDKGIPVEKLIVRSNGVELHDHNTLHECGLLDHSQIEISLKRSPPATSSSKPTTNKNNNSININSSNNNKPKIPKAPKKLKILVVTMYETKTIPLEVNARDKVKELRKELDRVNQREPLNLSEEGFFFIHRQEVMYEERSFEWHNVRQGDKIDIFNGRVTEGS